MLSLLVFLLVSNLSTYVRGECGLAEWTVQPPADGDVTVDLDDNGNKIYIKYKAVDQLYKVTLYNRCDIPNGRTELAATLMTVDTSDPALDADGCQDIDATITMMVAELDGSDIYKDIAGTTTAEINFCTELVLLLPNDSGVSASVNGEELTDGLGVTFHQLNTTVNVDFLNGFEITSVNLVYDEETISTTDKVVDYGITECQCSEDGTCYDEATVEEAKISQSKNLFLCFEVTAPDIVIKHVSLLDFTQGTEADSNELRLNAVSAAATWNALTTVAGETTQKVQVTSRLIELFFQKIDLPVTAIGSLVLDFQSTAERKLQQVAFNVPSRKLADTADFSVENIPLELDTGSAVATSTLYMMFVFVPIVLLF